MHLGKKAFLTFISALVFDSILLCLLPIFRWYPVQEEDTTFNSKITITVSKASLEAIRLVESFGGKIETRYHSMEERLMMSAPLVFLNRPRPPPLMPTRQKLRDYYTNPLNRGYLAYTQRPKTNLFKVGVIASPKIYLNLPHCT